MPEPLLMLFLSVRASRRSVPSADRRSARERPRVRGCANGEKFGQHLAF
ncbi:hypothetical protein HMPREF0972_01404 [Actinomyces sp. oral taxon 848 str. F0332]|nr:hypothetical protein HMPREF0972_01404 [Actinomyces sp. oral taxon 848 str. F0332]